MADDGIPATTTAVITPITSFSITSVTSSSTTSTFTSASNSRMSTRGSTGNLMKIQSHYMKVRSSPDKVVGADETSTHSNSDLWARLDEQEKQLTLLKEALAESENAVLQRDETLKNMDGRLNRLENRVSEMSTSGFMKDHVIKELQKQVVNLQQYTRRYSVSISGITKQRHEKREDLKKEIEKIIEKAGSDMSDVDKFHRDGPVRGNDQQVILRFKTHSAKEAFFRARKQNDTIKVRPSLTKANKDVLNEAVDFLEKTQEPFHRLQNPPHFVMANMHGNIQVKMHKETTKGLFFQFNTMEQFISIIEKCNSVSPEDEAYTL